ncbi:MAG: hypothetical protein ACOYOK_02980 [Pseudobdellovibrionaceae bacterium]
MKFLMVLISFLVTTASALAAPQCDKNEGAIVYDSSTVFKNSALFINPRFVLSPGQEVYISATYIPPIPRTRPAGYYTSYNVCLALGLQGSTEAGKGLQLECLRSRTNENILAATFDMHGNLEGLIKSDPLKDCIQVVRSIVCYQ